MAVVVPDAAPAAAANTAANTASVSPSQAKPDEPFTLTGRSPGCPNQPFAVTQTYTNNVGGRTRQEELMAGGQSGADGSFTANLVVPAGATRSNIYRPYGGWQYDAVEVTFPGCPEGLTGAHLIVLSMRFDQHIHLSTTAPRTGSEITVSSENCVGGALSTFTWVIDNAGSYFLFDGTFAGTTYTGIANLAEGYRGSEFPTGAAHVSQPLGAKDVIVQVPCVQSEGPASVAAADKLQHLSFSIDITIRPATDAAATSGATASRTSKSSNNSRATANQGTLTAASVPGAEPATAITRQPTFVG
jgi:hypothetical protein